MIEDNWRKRGQIREMEKAGGRWMLHVVKKRGRREGEMKTNWEKRK